MPRERSTREAINCAGKRDPPMNLTKLCIKSASYYDMTPRWSAPSAPLSTIAVALSLITPLP